ncbi:MAG: hypothetical protein M1830_007961 [Pleopsidium flavum]|nr:MAG: hypothetical protein M1830_007961 [Pleopsidium flavum]
MTPGLNGLLKPSQRPAKRKASSPQLKTQPARKIARLDVQAKQVSHKTPGRTVSGPGCSITLLPPIRLVKSREGTPVRIPNWRTGAYLSEELDEDDDESLPDSRDNNDDWLNRIDDDSLPDSTSQLIAETEKFVHQAARDQNVKPDGDLRECTICMGSHKPGSFPTRDELPSGCFHGGNTCRACISASITSDIEGKFFDNVGCPNCRASWDRYYIGLYATEAIMMRYETMGMLKVVEAMPNFLWCLSPDCNSGQINQAGDAEPIVTCVACGFKMCFTHQIAWHSGLTCTQYDAPSGTTNAPVETTNDTRARTTKEEQETAAKLQGMTKPCPRCGVRIQKSGGCEHMTCTLCHASSFQTVL